MPEQIKEQVVGVLLVGAEGCAEAAEVPWLRDATPEEEAAFINRVCQMIKDKDGSEAAKKADPRDWYVDGNNRPYWLKAVIDHPELPDVARQKAQQYQRVLRLVD
jgi:hypothetical protein